MPSPVRLSDIVIRQYTFKQINHAEDKQRGASSPTGEVVAQTKQTDVEREVHGVLEDVAVDDEQMLAKAASVFDTRVSAKKKLLLVLAVVAVFVISFVLGKYSSDLSLIIPAVGDHIMWWGSQIKIGCWHIVDWFCGLTGTVHATPCPPEYPIDNVPLDKALFSIRFPRVVVALLVGAALSTAGASYQGMFKNPLVSPDLLGASAGASLGACLSMLLGLPNIITQLFAFAGGMLAVACVVGLNRMIRADAMLGLILGGILVSTLFQSGTSIIKLLADADDKLPAITYWLMGSFSAVDNKDMLIALPVLIIGFVLLMTQRWNLNALSFGEDEARSLGVNTSRTRLLVILGATLLSSASVAVSGMIGWVGLVVPHLARAVVGPNYRVLLPTTMLVGGVFLLIVDDVARMLLTLEIPIGLLTSILGVPFFIFIYRKNMRGW